MAWGGEYGGVKHVEDNKAGDKSSFICILPCVSWRSGCLASTSGVTGSALVTDAQEAAIQRQTRAAACGSFARHHWCTKYQQGGETVTEYTSDYIQETGEKD